MEGKRINRGLYVDYQGTRIYVCCNACVKAVEKNPGKYLTKLRGP
jgi:YHS domain-containing protein